MATHIMPLSTLVDRNQYICDRMKIELSSQKQDVCFLYPKEGMQFRIHKVRLPSHVTLSSN